MATYSNSRIQLRIDTEGAWQSNNPQIEAGELCISSDKLDFKVGAGSAWSQASYCIKNNPDVVSAKTTATNAATAASNALNRANQAYSLAQAASQSAGRIVNIDVLKDAVSNQQAITINADFLKRNQNTDFILPEMGMISASAIDINEIGDVNDTMGNTITFTFYTSEAVYIRSSLFTIAPASGKIMVIAGNDGARSFYNEHDTITIPADYIVECKLINNYILKYTATKWS